MSSRRVLALLPWMLLMISPSVFGCALDVAILDGGAMSMGRDTLLWDGVPGEFTAAEAGCNRFYQPSTSPDGSAVAVWAGSDAADCIVILRSTGVEILGPYESAGLPAWDSSGDLWYTADGMLLRNSEPTGVSLDAHHISISPEGLSVVFTDREDRILVMSVETGDIDIVSDAHRFYGPFFNENGDIFSPSLDGGIWMFSGDEAIEVGSGEQPVWWPEKDRLVFIRTTDDGERLLTSDIWTWSRDAGALRLAETASRLETNPAPSADGIFFVDAATGNVGFVEVTE